MSKELISQAIYRMRRIVTGAYGSDYKPVYYCPRTAQDVVAALEALLADLRENPRLCSQDIESMYCKEFGERMGDYWHPDYKVWCLGFSVDDYQAICIPFDPDPYLIEKFGLTSIHESPRILEIVKEIAEMQCLHHSTADALGLSRYGVRYKDLEDSMLVNYAIDDTAGDNGVDDLARFHTEEGGYKEREYKNNVPETLADVDWDRLTHYCCHDTDIERRIFFILKGIAERENVWGQAWVPERGQLPRGYTGILKVSNRVGIKMTIAGAAVDRPHLEKLIGTERDKERPLLEEFYGRPEVEACFRHITALAAAEKDKKKRELLEKVQTIRDIKSSRDWTMEILLYDICGYPCLNKTAHGARQISAEDLEKVRDQKPQHARLIDLHLEVSRINKKLGTYLLPYVQPKINGWDDLDPAERIARIRSGRVERYEYLKADGLVHPRFNFHIARSGRSSSENPNFQNIINDVLIKMMFRARKWRVNLPGTESKRGKLVAGDFAQHEVRMAAWLCRDPNMIRNLEIGFHLINLALLEKLIGPHEVTQIDKKRHDILEDTIYKRYLRNLLEDALQGQGVLAPHKDPAQDVYSVLSDLYEHDYKQILAMLGENPEFKPIVLEWKNRFKVRKTVAKESTFGPLYGMTEGSFAAIQGIPREEAAEVFRIDRQTYPLKHAYFAEVKARARKDGFVQSVFGKKRRLDYKGARDDARVAELDRMAGNTIVQGPSSDIGLLCMDRIQTTYEENDLQAVGIGTIHDSVMSDCAPDTADVVLQIKQHVMESVPTEALGSDHVRFLAELEVGDNWGEMKPWSPA